MQKKKIQHFDSVYIDRTRKSWSGGASARITKEIITISDIHCMTTVGRKVNLGPAEMREHQSKRASNNSPLMV